MRTFYAQVKVVELLTNIEVIFSNCTKPAKPIVSSVEAYLVPIKNTQRRRRKIRKFEGLCDKYVLRLYGK